MAGAANFWEEEKEPLIALAPMEDVTDTVLRELLLSLADPGRLHVVMTEFASTDQLLHKRGRARVAPRLIVSEAERELLRKTGVKIVAQIWGNTPAKYERVIREQLAELDFDGIDVNMGCPARKVVKRGCCSGLIDNPNLAKEIIQAAKEATTVPISVKTRIGLKTVATEEWIGHLLDAAPAAIAIHGRTQEQMTKVPAQWDEIAKAARLRDQRGLSTPIIGNGDVLSVADAHRKTAEYGLDGVMIGRGIFENPWIFSANQRPRSREEKLALLWRHTTLFEQTWGARKDFHLLRRYYSIYTKGFPGAAELRNDMMQTNDVKEVLAALKRHGWQP